MHFPPEVFGRSEGQRRHYVLFPEYLVVVRLTSFHQSWKLYRKICRLSAEGEVYLHQVRYNLPTGVFEVDHSEDWEYWRGSQSGGTALRALHHGRDAI